MLATVFLRKRVEKERLSYKANADLCQLFTLRIMGRCRANASNPLAIKKCESSRPSITTFEGDRSRHWSRQAGGVEGSSDSGVRGGKETRATTGSLVALHQLQCRSFSGTNYGNWQLEVDFRHLKTTMQLDVCRGKSPNVVEKEFWAHVAAYNLVRSVMWDVGDT